MYLKKPECGSGYQLVSILRIAPFALYTYYIITSQVISPQNICLFDHPVSARYAWKIAFHPVRLDQQFFYLTAQRAPLKADSAWCALKSQTSPGSPGFPR